MILDAGFFYIFFQLMNNIGLKHALFNTKYCILKSIQIKHIKNIYNSQ